MSGIPFVGENGYYPQWAKGSGRWIFQRTLNSVGGMMAGFAERAAESVAVAKEVIVWVPPSRGLLARFTSSGLHKERELALGQLSELGLLCYGKGCPLELESHLAVRKFVRETGMRPEEWALTCPVCRGTVGPDLAPVDPHAILQRWIAVGRPALDHPAASAAFGSAKPVIELLEWIKKNEPSHLELAYLGQQLWPTIQAMLQALVAFGHARMEYSSRAQTAAHSATNLLMAICKETAPSLLKALVGEERAEARQELLAPVGTELLAFALHLTDRFAFSRLGPEKTGGFMDALLPAVQQTLRPPLDSELEHLYNTKNAFYSSFQKLFPRNNESAKGTLLWEFGKSLCLAFAPDPEAMPRVIKFGMEFLVRIHHAYDAAKVFPESSEGYAS